MISGLFYLVLLLFSRGSVLESVCVAVDGKTDCSSILNPTKMELIPITGIQSQTDIQIRFCPPYANKPYCHIQLLTTRFSIQFSITGIDNEEYRSSHSFQSPDSKCATIHSSLFSDGSSPFILPQGIYSLSISVKDHIQTPVYSTTYSFALTNSNGLSLSAENPIVEGGELSLSTLQKVPISLILPPNVNAHSIRWLLSRSSSSTSISITTIPISPSSNNDDGSSQVFGDEQSTTSLLAGYSVLHALVYTTEYGLPAYSIAYSVNIQSSGGGGSSDKEDEDDDEDREKTVPPTVPPRIAPTVPPSSSSSSEQYFCGDGICNEQETCENCPIDCGLCNSYTCSQSVCSLPTCQCSLTHHPTLYETENLPQFVAITWDDAQTPTTFEQVMKVSREATVRMR